MDHVGGIESKSGLSASAHMRLCDWGCCVELQKFISGWKSEKIIKGGKLWDCGNNSDRIEYMAHNSESLEELAGVGKQKTSVTWLIVKTATDPVVWAPDRRKEPSR